MVFIGYSCIILLVVVCGKGDRKLTENELRQYRLEYNKKHYKRIPLDVSVEMYQEIKTAADSMNATVNGFIKSAIDDKLAASKDGTK